MGRTRFVAAVVFATTTLLGSTAIVAEAAPPKPNRITLNATAKTLTVGQKFTARVKSVKPAKANRSVSWASSKKGVATVTGKGVVKAVGAGTTTITAKSKVRPKVKRTIRVTVKGKKLPVVIDPKLLGNWGLYSTNIGVMQTFHANGTWTMVVISEGSISKFQSYSKGNYQAKNGKIQFANIVYQTRETNDDPWGPWKTAADPNRAENYEVGTDEYGEYLATEDFPDPVTPESARYRRSE